MSRIVDIFLWNHLACVLDWAFVRALCASRVRFKNYAGAHRLSGYCWVAHGVHASTATLGRVYRECASKSVQGRWCASIFALGRGRRNVCWECTPKGEHGGTRLARKPKEAHGGARSTRKPEGARKGTRFKSAYRCARSCTLGGAHEEAHSMREMHIPRARLGKQAKRSFPAHVRMLAEPSLPSTHVETCIPSALQSC